ncbi:MAG: four helix bundle protein [Marinilabiliales bacterium]
MKSHKDLEVWKRSVGLVTTVYELTKSFPKEELYGLTNQRRRAAVSIPSNIAEGASRNYNKEFIQFLYIALGSISELETQIIISEKLIYLTNDSSEKIQRELIELKNMTLGLIKYLKSNKL